MMVHGSRGGKNKEKRDLHYDTFKLSILIGLIWVGLVIVHATKALDFFPLVIPDEYTYTSDIRHRPYSAALVPNYFYYAIYSFTNMFGDSFFNVGRVINSLFFMASAPFLYSISKRVTNKNQALILTFFILISPISSYTAYFIPESLYFTAFWILFWYMTKYATALSCRNMATIGMAIAILSLIKVHGIFLLPGLLIFIFFQTSGLDWKGRLKKVAILFTSGIAGFAILRCGVGFLFAGVSGLNPLGNSYSELATDASQVISFYSFLADFLYSIFGHLLSLGLLTGGIIIVITVFIIRPASLAESQKSFVVHMAICSFSFMLPLIIISALFTAMVAANFPDDAAIEIKRVQWRYYNFIFPSIPIIAAGILKNITVQGKQIRTPLLFTLPLLLIVYAMATGISGFLPISIPDCPELGSLVRFRPMLYFFLTLSGILCFGYMARPLFALRIHVFYVLPLLCIIGTTIVQYETIYGFGIFPDIYDKAGIFAKEYLGHECDDLTVVDGFVNSAKKALIHIDNPNTELLPQFENNIDMDKINPDKTWLLAIGDFVIPDKLVTFSVYYQDPAQTEELTQYMRLHGNTRVMLKYTLMRLKEYDFSVNFSHIKLLWPVQNVLVAGNTMTIDYTIPLSGSFQVSIENGTYEEYQLQAVDKDGLVIATVSSIKNDGLTALTIRSAKANRLILSKPSPFSSQQLNSFVLKIVPSKTK